MELPVVNLNFQDATDEELVSLAQAGDTAAEEYLINKYQKMVYLWTRSYFLQGGEIDDLLQEGMIGLFKAIRDYTGGSSSFWSFAKLCITRNVISAIKGTTRQKHIPLNSYTSLYKPVYENEGDRTLMEMLTDNKVEDPESITINRNISRTRRERSRTFSLSLNIMYLDCTLMVILIKRLQHSSILIQNRSITLCVVLKVKWKTLR